MDCIKTLIDDFISNAIIQGKATYEGDYKKANKASKRLFQLKRVMEKDINIAKQMLDVLLEHENINVKIWASGIALDLNYKPQLAKETLIHISQMTDAGILGLNAEMSLKVRNLDEIYSNKNIHGDD